MKERHVHDGQKPFFISLKSFYFWKKSKRKYVNTRDIPIRDILRIYLGIFVNTSINNVKALSCWNQLKWNAIIIIFSFLSFIFWKMNESESRKNTEKEGVFKALKSVNPVLILLYAKKLSIYFLKGRKLTTHSLFIVVDTLVPRLLLMLKT